MTFEIVRIFAILTEIAQENSISDYVVIISDKDYENHDTLIMKWDEIPACFNCKVLSYSFDFETKRIYIKSEVEKHGKI